MWLANCIEWSRKSHNAPGRYPTIHHFVAEMDTRVHIYLLQNAVLWDMGLVHCGICATGLFNGYEKQRLVKFHFKFPPVIKQPFGNITCF